MAQRWRFVPSAELREIIAGFETRSTDWSPVMQKIAIDAESNVEGHVFASHGDGTWAPTAKSTLQRDKYPRRDAGSRKGILQWTGRLRNVGADWSPRNAVVMSAWPHAHLQQGGTQRHATPNQVKGKKKSKKFTQSNLGTGMHSPVREFVYMDEGRSESLYEPWILDYFFGELAE